MFGAPIRIEGAGRTDAGVHALGAARARRRSVRNRPRGLPPRPQQSPAARHPRHRRRRRSRTISTAASPRSRRRTSIASGTPRSRTCSPCETHAHVAQPLDAGGCATRRRRWPASTTSRRSPSRRPRSARPCGRSRRSTSCASGDGDHHHRHRGRFPPLHGPPHRRIARSRSAAASWTPDAIWTEARWTAPAKGLTLWEVSY